MSYAQLLRYEIFIRELHWLSDSWPYDVLTSLSSSSISLCCVVICLTWLISFTNSCKVVQSLAFVASFPKCWAIHYIWMCSCLSAIGTWLQPMLDPVRFSLNAPLFTITTIYICTISLLRFYIYPASVGKYLLSGQPLTRTPIVTIPFLYIFEYECFIFNSLNEMLKESLLKIFTKFTVLAWLSP